MKEQEKIRAACERAVQALSRRDTVGRGTARTRVTLRDGLLCEIEDGPWTLTADFPEKAGGGGQAPNPGVLGRSALGSCLAIGYALWAARRRLPLTSLEVEIQADYDARGEYGVDGSSPAYREIRYIVTVESDASEEEVLRVLDEADAHSPYHVMFSAPQTLHRKARVTAPAE